MLTYSGAIERTIDRHQDALVGNRLRVFVDADTHSALTLDRETGTPGLAITGELSIKRRELKATCIPLNQGTRAKVTRFRGSFDLLQRAGFSVEFSFLFWLECRGAVAFARAKAVDRVIYHSLQKDAGLPRGDFGFVTLGRLHWTPRSVDACDVLTWELSVMQDDAAALAGYERWLTEKADGWVRLAEVRARLAQRVNERAS